MELDSEIQPKKVRKGSGYPVELANDSARFRVNRIDSVVAGIRSVPILEDQLLDTNNMHHNGVDNQGYEDGDQVPPMLGSYPRSNSLVNGTQYGQPIGNATIEALPRMDNYRNIMSLQAVQRPTLEELRGDGKGPEDGDVPIQKIPGAGGHGIKLGWIQGVLIPCLLNIWGVMLFLRLSWVVAHSGTGGSLIIIGISSLVTVITTLSLSAICTNGDVKGGGIYYLVSRSLGPEFGASVGVVFAFANAVAASMNTIGFCDSLNDLLHRYNYQIIDNGVNDTRIIGSAALLLMIIICAVGMEWEAKAQNFLVVAIILAILDFIIGVFVGPLYPEQRAKGFVGLNGTVFANNWNSDYRFSEDVNQDFISVFSIFFPSVTGIQAGANICGDLKDPASAIPKGTLLALLISMVSYAWFVFMAAGSLTRDASGNVAEIATEQYLNCTGRTCAWGLHNSFSMMQEASIFWPFIYLGCFAATLSTALTNLLSVPRLIQALGIDQIYPGLIFFSKGYGKSGEPYRGYVLTLIISVAFLLIANLNAIAPLISNFYLASYGLINFCTFHAAFVKPLGWRPTFRYYNSWLSLAGAIMCFVIMILISYVTTIITVVTIFLLYMIVVYRKPDVNWGSSTQANIYKNALTATHELTALQDHVKNYRPQVLVLSGKPSARPALVSFANLLTKNLSLAVCGNVEMERLQSRNRTTLLQRGYTWLKIHKVKSFYTIVESNSLEDGARALIQASGVGKLKPNIMLMGYKADWQTSDFDEMKGYFQIIHDSFDNSMAVAILRLTNGLDYSHILDVEPKLPVHSDSGSTLDTTEQENSQFFSDNVNHKHEYSISEAEHKKPKEKKSKNTPEMMYSYEGGKEVPKDILDLITVFEKKQKKGTIDVWWLYDDGGLTLLLPYIISTRHNWGGCRLRIFALANQKEQMELEQINMANLLSKFRIDYSDLKMLQDVTQKPRQSTKDHFNKLIEKFRDGKGVSVDDDPEIAITDAELTALKEKTNRHLRLREMLLENSKDSNLIVMTLPMSRKGVVSAPLYMAWLEMLTQDMPPFVLVRGNQQSVLTFYS